MNKVTQPTWSPNGRFIAFCIDTTLKVLDLFSKSIKTLSTRYPAFFICWRFVFLFIIFIFLFFIIIIFIVIIIFNFLLLVIIIIIIIIIICY